jgi:hypothetical protein
MASLRTSLFAALAMLASPASAWGPTGHQIVGAIADQQLHPHAKAKVQSLLNMPLRTAGPWADCVKDVKGGPHGHYVEDPRYKASCQVFWTPAEEAEMVQYANANWENCVREGSEECHAQYHYTDIAVGQSGYNRSHQGTSDHDLVQAIRAAILVLKGGTAPAPFKIPNQRIALLMLAHLVGDIHQPLHVGAIYLDANGKPVNPDAGPYDPGSFTRGGNCLFDNGKKLHSEWDDVGAFPSNLAPMVANAAAVSPTVGAVEDFPMAWAKDSLVQAKKAFAGMSFAPTGSHHWNIQFGNASDYRQKLRAIQREQLVKAGARMAELLNKIWP